MPLFAKPLIGLVMIGAAPITGLLALRVRSDVDKPAIKWFSLMMLAGVGWALTSGIGTIFWNATVSMVFDRFLLFTATFTGISWFLFATEFANKQTVSDHTFHVLLIVPVITQCFVWIPQSQWLVYSQVTMTNGLLTTTLGPWGMFDLWVFGYGLTFAAFAVLVGELLTADNRARKIQVGLLIGGMSIPVVISVAYTLDLTSVNFTAYGIAATGVIFLVAIREESNPHLFSVNHFAWDQAINDIDDPILNFDSEYTLTDVNPSARRVFDIEVGMDAEHLRELNPELAPIFDEERPQDIVTHVDGAKRYYSYQSSRVEYGRGATGQTVVFRDITAQKHQENRLQRQNERLDEFASVVSHDLRNPLTVVTGRLELLREDISTDEFETIQRNLQRMETIIDDVLKLARAGETVETGESVRLAGVATEAWQHVHTDQSTFEMRVSEDVLVEADRNRLLTVFENLFRNALDHNEPPVTVHVGTFGADETLTDGEGSIGVYIEDDGDGIPAEECGRIFEHGYTTNDDGTGFGLSIVHDIVEAHNWDIHVTNSSGARFEITGIPESNG
ncbi:sensor histidine kinase [Haloarcula sp. GH36]|uniref:sensor histidine kinase n=1 Tax=Haloarcula montana TaxID=3111776 RepID=UPI002D79164C|nr:histidine kinase N-terminal 7TM domain-containing protein [Haloarcula sp. GH36]